MSGENNTPNPNLLDLKPEPGCSNVHLLPIPNNSKEDTKHSRKRKATAFSDNGPLNNIKTAVQNLVHNGVDQIKMEPADCVKTEPYAVETITLSDDDSSKLIKKEKRPCKLKPNDGENSESSDHDSEDFEFKPKVSEYGNTKSTAHQCESILAPAVFKQKVKKCKINNHLTRELIDGDLLPCKIGLVPENESYPRDVKNYEWEKFIDNEFVSKIDNRIKQTVDAVLLPQDEYERIRNEVIADLNSVYKREKNPPQWYCFGSVLCDVVYWNAIFKFCYEHSNKREVLRKLEATSRFFELRNIEGRSLFQHRGTKQQVIVSHVKPLRMKSDFLMKLYLSVNPNLKYLIVYVELILKKYWVHKQHLFLKSCAIFWLVVFFMQQKKLLPAVIDVRKKGQICCNDGWDCALPENYLYPTESVSLYSLLLGFFDFYQDFDFLAYVICPYLGRVITLSDIENLKLRADEWSTYITLIKNGDKHPFTRSVLNLQDPTDLSLNIGASAFNCDDLNMFKALCHYLSNALPKRMSEIEQMDCLCRMLPDFIDLINHHAAKFVNYQIFTYNLLDVNEVGRKKLNQSHILEAIRKLMEFVFKLELKSVNVTQSLNLSISVFKRQNKLVTIPAMYFEYCSSENTWKSDYMKEIVPDKEPVRIYLRCEIALLENPKEMVRIYAQGEPRFMAFLRSNFQRMFGLVLNHKFCS